MSIKIYWGSLLRTLRLEKHLTQDEVANILRIRRQAYSYLECGKVHPSAEQLAILSNIYDLDLYRYAIKCMPVDYVAEQREFRTYINSAGIESERKRLRKEKKLKDKESKKEEQPKVKNEIVHKKVPLEETLSVESYESTFNGRGKNRVIPVESSDILETMSALEAENKLFDRVINSEKSM